MKEWDQFVQDTQRMGNRLRLPTKEDKEDVLQEAYLALYQRGELEHPEGYLKAILRTKVADFYRANRQFPVPLGEWVADPGDMAEEAITNVLTEQVVSLAPQCVIFKAEGYQDSEIANHFGIDRRTVRQRIHRGRVELRAQFERGGEPI